MKGKTYSIDFETYYDKNTNVTELGLHRYVQHPACDIYLVAVFSEEARFAYVGPPQSMDWQQLDGSHLVAHHARFDRACFMRLQELGVIPENIRVSWDCTADMAAALGIGRSLEAAVGEVFQVPLSKAVRGGMKGKSWQQAVEAGQAQEVAAYCLKDAWYCYRLWKELSGEWPEKERRLSAMTRDMCDLGVCIDREELGNGLQVLGKVMVEAQEKLPWAEKAAILSPKALREECQSAGIPAPASLAEDSLECQAWEDEYGDSFPWVAAMRDYRKANTLYAKLRTLERQLRQDGTFPYSLKYFGAHTGRWSGDAGFNIQNLPRAPLFGVDLRRMIKPRPGCAFVISDLGQIEQRVLSWLAGDNSMMEELEKGVSVYEAHARATMGWKGGKLKEENPDLYRLAKARVLGLGYGAGARVFVAIAKGMAGLDITPQQAQRAVSDFRATNRLITSLWAKLERAFSSHVGGDFILPLPSGRNLYYRRLARTDKGLTASVQGRRMAFFGGKLTENLTSATARDVLGEIWLRLADAGYRVVMHIHDEVVVEVPERQLDTAAKEIHQIMTTTPDWLAGLPLSAETITSTHYTK